MITDNQIIDNTKIPLQALVRDIWTYFRRNAKISDKHMQD